MTRYMCSAAAAILFFSHAAAAQPLRVPSHGSSSGPAIRAASAVESAGQTGNESEQQPARSFDALRLRVTEGDIVHVVEASGRETTGRVATLSEVALALTADSGRVEFAADDVRRIDLRRRDSVLNGVLIGAGAGALLGFGLGRSADSPSCPRSGIECGQGAMLGTVNGAVWGALSGWLTDALIRKRDVLYAR